MKHPPDRRASASNAVVHPRWRRVLRVLLRLGLIGGVAWAMTRGHLLPGILVALLFVVSVWPGRTRQQVEARVPDSVEALAVVFLFGSLLLGEMAGFYDRFWWWDVLMHLGSAFLLGLIAFVLVSMFSARLPTHLELTPGFLALFTVVFATAGGTFWEIFEFVVDRTLGTSMQRGSLADTMGDLIVDTVGAIIVAGVGYLRLRFRPRTPRRSAS